MIFRYLSNDWSGNRVENSEWNVMVDKFIILDS